MLDTMRRHASSWLIRIAFGVIIIVFIFFFGYSSYQKGSRGGRGGGSGEVALTVGGQPVSFSEFDYFLKRNLEQIKQTFKDAPPNDFIDKYAESSTIRQLVNREVALEQADALGLLVPDAELADTIRKLQAKGRGGDFDAVAYRHQFLPFFKNTYGMDFESFVRQDLIISSLQSLFDRVGAATPGAADEPAEKEKQSTWTFEVVALDGKALVDAKSFSSEEEVKREAKGILSRDPREWKKELSKLKIEPKKVGPLKIADRRTLFDGAGKFDDYKSLFTLSKEHPVISEPIEIGSKLYLARLIERSEKGVDSKEEETKGSFLSDWLGQVAAKAKIQNFMEKKK